MRVFGDFERGPGTLIRRTSEDPPVTCGLCWEMHNCTHRGPDEMPLEASPALLPARATNMLEFKILFLLLPPRTEQSIQHICKL